MMLQGLRDLPRRKVSRKVQAQILRTPLRLVTVSERRGQRSSIINKLTAKLTKIVTAEALHKQTKRMSQRLTSIKTQPIKTNISIIHKNSLNMMMDHLGEADRESC